MLSTLLSLLIFLSTTTATEARRNPRICSSSCGDIPNISYPFRLNNDPSDCGDPDFQLSCHDNATTIINFHGGLYQVKRISYEEHAIRVADVNLANGSCGLPYRSLSIDEVWMDARYPGWVNYNNSYTLNYVRCSSNISNLAKTRVPCLSRNTSNVYVNVTDYPLSSSDDVPKSCKVISTLPTYYELDSMREVTYETVLKMQESGFDMMWSVECRDCRAKGRGCVYYNYRDTTPIFECEKEYDYYALVRLIYTVISLSFLAVFIGLVRFILLPMVIFGFLLHKYLSTRKKKKNDSENKKSSLQSYTYPDILALSNNLKEKIGEGCFGSVYKGKLPANCAVVVKLLGSSKLREEKFVSEISTMNMIQHPNLVPILGFCCEGSKYALVYQYMPNGSLDKYIFSKGGNSHSFGWEKLHEIALGTAQGIEFLHGKSNACIAHSDIKPQNILLDQNFIPKIADFCLANLYPKKHDFLSLCTTNEETIGYMAPELVSRDSGFGTLSCKSDAYSFGMLLLELASGRRHVDVDAIYSSKVHFPSWVYEVNERGDLEVENMTETDALIARKLCIIGLWCTQTKASDRPSMTRVVQMLQGSINDLEMPPKPVFFLPKHKGVLELESDSPKQKLIPEPMERSS